MTKTLPPAFVKLLAMRYMNRGSPRDSVKWAEDALAGGYDCDSICALAGLDLKGSLPNDFEIDSLLKRSIDELGFEFPERADCIHEYVRIIAEEIVSGKRSPEDGAREL